MQLIDHSPLQVARRNQEWAEINFCLAHVLRKTLYCIFEAGEGGFLSRRVHRNQ